MFTDGQIWSTILRLKVFRPEDVLQALNPPAGFRKWVKQKVHSIINKQAELGLLRRIVDNPPVFATQFADEQDVRRVYKTCVICGKPFIPTRSDVLTCSEDCRQKLRNKRTKRYRRQRGLGQKKRRWTAEEIALLEELLKRPAKAGEYKELSALLGRSAEAIKKKVKELRRKNQIQHKGGVNHGAV